MSVIINIELYSICKKEESLNSKGMIKQIKMC